MRHSFAPPGAAAGVGAPDLRVRVTVALVLVAAHVALIIFIGKSPGIRPRFST
jgi:hypothetical protein